MMDLENPSKIKKFGQILYAIFIGPCILDPAERFNYHAYHSQEEVNDSVETHIGSKVLKILDVHPMPTFFQKPSPSEKYDLPAFFRQLDHWTLELDVPLDGFEIHPTLFSYQRKGFTLIGYSHHVDGRTIDDAIRVSIEPCV